MLKVNSQKAKQLIDKLDGQTVDGVTFKLEKIINAFFFELSFEGGTAEKAKDIVRRTSESISKTAFTKIDIL
ncbi:MAG: hypothetical protein Q4B60_04090 [Erysipelotrichaceae bacterium]|nr:hypothetical protein [Erysipelotrichaceae bacterium]